jgi:hypothetical protein
MSSESTLLLCLNLALLGLHLFLLLNDAQEFVTLGLGLLSQHDFALNELLSARNIKLLGLPFHQLGF